MSNPIYADPEFISALERALNEDGGQVGSCVIGTENYAAINGDEKLRKIYAGLIERGLNIGFNPTVPSHVDAGVSGTELVITNRAQGAGLSLSSKAEAGRMSHEIDVWYQQAVPLTNFDLSVKEIEQAFYEQAKAS